ncbi:MAG: hypothetical protein M5U25_19525 [Planctomycetota bacterium]|nr:hypothetical protein [Planctomycetota bacterium]
MISAACCTSFFALAAPQLNHALEHAEEARAPEAILGREVGAGRDGLAIGRQKQAHGPAAAPVVEGLGDGHVDGVDVRALFAIDLDADEVLVEVFGDALVLEAFALHHVAPVAGGVADAQEHQLVLAAGLVECGLAPGHPIHGVVGVLQQVGAGFIDQRVGFVFAHVRLSFVAFQPILPCSGNHGRQRTIP